MRILTLSILPFLFLSEALAQEPVRRHEIGLTLLTVNSSRVISATTFYRPRTEYPNAMFYRFRFEDFGIRVQAGYFAIHRRSDPDNQCVACETVDEKEKSYRAGVGLQWSPFEKQKKLYSFVDVNYRDYQSLGTIDGGHNFQRTNFTVKRSGIESFAGMGWTARMLPRMNLSTEASIVPFYYKTTILQSSNNAKFAPVVRNEGRVDLSLRVHLTFLL
jgi:hypothetical protein